MKRTRFVRSPVLCLAALSAAAMVVGCAANPHHLIVSVADQRMAVLKHDQPIAFFPVSTSRFCIGDAPNCNGTPLGRHEVAKKIGSGEPLGMKFKNRKATGEVVPVNAAGRDPIVTRILWLRGLEPWNKHSYSRFIYIHGTPEEWKIGCPASYGCVRMKSCDIKWVYDKVGKGSLVDIVGDALSNHCPTPLP